MSVSTVPNVTVDPEERQDLHQAAALPSSYSDASFWIAGLLMVGVALRLSGLGASALHYDEAFSLVMTRQNLPEMIGSLTGNISPPSWEVLLWFVTRLIGRTEIAGRILPLIAGCASLWVTYRLSRELRLPPRQQIASIAILAALPFQLWIAQEARMYAILTLLYTVGILFAWRGSWLRLALVMTLMLWFHDTAVFFIPALLLIALIKHPNAIKSIAGSAVLAGASWLPWLPFVLRQSGEAIPWFPPFTLGHVINNLEGAFFANALTEGWQLFGFLAVVLSSLVALCMMVGDLGPRIVRDLRRGGARGFASAIVQSLRGEKPAPAGELYASRQLALGVAVIVPFALFVSYASLFQNVFIYRTISPLGPAWVLWMSPTVVFGQVGPRGRTWVNVVLAALWTIVMVVALAGWSPASKGSDLRSMTEFIKDEWQAGDVVYHATGLSAVEFWYYMPNVDHYLLNEKSVVGSGIIKTTKIPVEEASLESIPHRRAWIVWSHDQAPAAAGEHVDERMEEYVKSCLLAGRLKYWHSWTTELYLCS